MGVGSPYHNPAVKPLPYDPQQAMALLKKAGWVHDKERGCLYKDGKPFEFTILVFKESQVEKKVASYIQLCLNDLGIRPRLRELPFEHLKKRYFRNTQFQAVLTEIRGAYRNPEHLQTFWSCIEDGKSGASGFKHSIVTRLIKKGIAEQEPQKRKKIFYEIDSLITSLQPGTFLFQKTAIDALSKRFSLPEHFSLTYEGIYNLRHASLRQE
jgi:peptide/nickel transport system substrate-binding protein